MATNRPRTIRLLLSFRTPNFGAQRLRALAELRKMNHTDLMHALLNEAYEREVGSAAQKEEHPHGTLS